MVEHKVQFAKQTDLKGSIAIGLDDAFQALAEALAGISDEQARAHPFADQPCVASILLHVLYNLDTYACEYQTGRKALEHDYVERRRLAAVQHKTADDAGIPTIDELRRRLSLLGEAAASALSQATEAELRGPRRAAESWFAQGRTAADAYMRTTWHTMAHVRQIWFLRGAMGITDESGWPQQHWA